MKFSFKFSSKNLVLRKTKLPKLLIIPSIPYKTDQFAFWTCLSDSPHNSLEILKQFTNKYNFAKLLTIPHNFLRFLKINYSHSFIIIELKLLGIEVTLWYRADLKAPKICVGIFLALFIFVELIFLTVIDSRISTEIYQLQSYKDTSFSQFPQYHLSLTGRGVSTRELFFKGNFCRQCHFNLKLFLKQSFSP